MKLKILFFISILFLCQKLLALDASESLMHIQYPFLVPGTQSWSYEKIDEMYAEEEKNPCKIPGEFECNIGRRNFRFCQNNRTWSEWSWANETYQERCLGQ